jgi:signal transduction histidine kinase
MTDRLTERFKQTWFRLGQFAVVGVLLLILLFDFAQGLGDNTAAWPLTLAEVASAGAVTLVWLVSGRLGPVALPLLATVVAGWSLFVSSVPAAISPQNGSFGLAETCALLGLLLVVVRRSELVLAVMGGGFLVAAVAAQPLHLGFDSETIIIGLLMALVAAAVAAAGAYLRAMDTGRSRQVQLVRVEQRAELARDLHDFVAHHVTGIVVQAQGAKIIGEQDPARAVAALEQIERAGAEAMTSMRRMVGVLRDVDGQLDAPVAPVAGIADLGPLVEGFSAAGSTTARLHLEGYLDDLPVELTSSAYRVVMEALTNVRRHAAGATVVDVVLHRTPGWLFVRIADNGPVVHPAGPLTHPGFGLIGLTERVDALGGRIQAGPGADGGWVVDAAVPVTRPIAR